MLTQPRAAHLAFLLYIFISYCEAVPYIWNVSSGADLIDRTGEPFRVESSRYSARDDTIISVPRIFGRAVSQDASCPDGYLCIQESCPGGIICPEGLGCFNFEGTVACGVQDQQICALNPDTFQAVGCSNGRICCHGNCYTSDAVCCDFPSNKCQVGELCNACDQGQTCGNGQCEGGGGGATPPSSTHSTTQQIPPPTTTTTRRTTPTSTTASPPSSSTPPPPPPHVVQSVDSFSNIGCYFDSTTARVLVVDSEVDQSANGMTVEKCVAFAQNGGFQYGGVEFGGECWVGNTLHGASKASDGDCNQICAGDSEEFCGNGNRIQIYQDFTWFDPTADELADALQQYNETLTQALDFLQAYDTDIKDLQQAVQAQSDGSQRVRRQSQTETIEMVEMRIRADSQTADLVAELLARAEANGNVLFLRGASADVERATQPIVDQDILNQLQSATSDAASAVSDAQSALADDVASISADSTAPLIDYAADKGVADSALGVVGVPFLPEAAAATGVFLVIFTLFNIFHHTSPGNPTSPPTPTASVTMSSASSSTCTFTEGPTPVIILTKPGISEDQFNEFVGTLPQDKESEVIVNSVIDFFIYVGSMDRCTSESLWDNPMVEAMALDRDIVTFDSDNVDPSTLDLTQSSSVKVRRHLKRRRAQLSKKTRNANISTRANPTIQNLALNPRKAYFQQNASPAHLKWISAQSRQLQNAGAFLDFEDYLYDDRSISAPGATPVRIYLIEADVLITHNDYRDRIRGVYRVGGSTEPGSNNHGTCMISLAAGEYSGVHKTADIVAVLAVLNSRRSFPLSQAILAFLMIMEDVINNHRQGKAVVSMSLAAPVALLWYTNGDRPTAQRKDVLSYFLPRLYTLGVPVVSSAGNFGLNRDKNIRDLSYHTPRRTGGRNTPLVVVGNADFNNNPVPTSQSQDMNDLGILTLYAPGDNVECALASADNAWGVEESGTSQATAITAGLMSYLLSDPDLHRQLTANGLENLPMAMKQFLITTSFAQKTNQFLVGLRELILLASGDNVNCSATDPTTIQGAPPQQALVVAAPTSFDHVISTTQVTEGDDIVLAAASLPSCYNRPP